MNTYKISKDNWATYQNFNSLQEAQDWTLVTLGDGYDVILSPDMQITPPTPEERLRFDKEFGSNLVDTFLLDNRLIVPAVTSNESLQLLSQFSDIEKLAILGDIKSVQILLGLVQTDMRLFTQERKDKYLDMISSYLQN
jgi:hypothetical protein